MRFDSRRRPSVSILLAAALLAGCGGEKSASDEAAPEDPAVAQAIEAERTPAASPETGPSDAPLEVADIDRWQKGMAGELEAVQAAAEKMKSARSGEDSMSAMMGVQETATVEAGARAAGVDLERYRTIRSSLSAAASYLTPELGGIDTTMLSPDQRAEMKRMNEAQLAQLSGTVPPAVVEALKPRASALRQQDLELVAARLKGAGI